MAELAESGGGGHEKKGKPKKLSTRVDLTPMVDLGFLLITFFMLATSLIKPQTMEIAMPSKDKVEEPDQTEVKASRAVTIILGKNHKVFYYEGTRTPEGVDPEVIPTDFSASGLRKLLVAKNRPIMEKVHNLKVELQNKKIDKEEFEERKTKIIDDKTAPVVIIKATDESAYLDLIDVLDEMAICNISKYAIVDISDFDKGLIATLNN